MVEQQQENYWTELSTALVDKVIDNEYQLLESLGHGAYGALFLGQSIKNSEYVAVKVLSKSNDLSQLQLQQLEIDIQSSLHHPHLLALHRVIQDKDFFYMVMELCDGGDLFDFVINDQEENPIREEATVKEFFTQILSAVEHMHKQGVYHRDIKLENVLLQQIEGDNEIDQLVCKVADFGLATRERYSMEFGCGSTSYLAPEHFVSSTATHLLPYDAAASDTWSLGILLLALMFGRNPWQESSAADAAYTEFKRNPYMLKDQLFPELSMATYKLLKSALAPNGSERISVAEFKQQFLAIENLYDYEEEEQQQLNEESITIPNSNSTKHNVHSFDSAFFSGNGMSWSDMVEEDETSADSPCTHASSPLCNPYSEDDDEDMFIHSGEKESWWL